ncbi:unnamed protein product [Blepharisma stoltei]|uniref:Uncharacterized protein n=1 Tax=Blepharisma stoltei TaxID=1481888 RepID=A0AAU9K627_9CILI|nr:unnamed protein product [Blepharisma stoltei]
MKTAFAQSFTSPKEEESLTSQVSLNTTNLGDMDINLALSARFQGLTPLEIKKMGYTIQQSIKNMQSQIESVQAESQNSYKEIELLEDEFSQVSEERNVFKDGYSKEVRSRIDMQDKYYSVPKVDDRFFFLTEAFSRPSTQSKSSRNLPLNNQFSATSITNAPFNRNRNTSSANPGPRLSTPYSFQTSPRPKTSVRVLRPTFSASGFNFLLPK